MPAGIEPELPGLLRFEGSACGSRVQGRTNCYTALDKLARVLHGPKTALRIAPERVPGSVSNGLDGTARDIRLHERCDDISSRVTPAQPPSYFPL